LKTAPTLQPNLSVSIWAGRHHFGKFITHVICGEGMQPTISRKRNAIQILQTENLCLRWSGYSVLISGSFGVISLKDVFNTKSVLLIVYILSF